MHFPPPSNLSKQQIAVTKSVRRGEETEWNCVPSGYWRIRGVPTPPVPPEAGDASEKGVGEFADSWKTNASHVMNADLVLTSVNLWLS